LQGEKPFKDFICVYPRLSAEGAFRFNLAAR